MIDLRELVLERLERAETVAAIRIGMEQSDRGEGISLDETEMRLRKKHGFSRCNTATSLRGS